MNLSGTINAFRLVYAPKLARPHVILGQFSELTFPLGKCIAANVKIKYEVDIPDPNIRAVVIDKDNCIARPHALEIWPAYKVQDSCNRSDFRINGNRS
jgi:phosphatidylglycerophosphatase GEP4